VPLTTRSLARPRPWWWRAARRVLRGPAPSWREVLYPLSNWPHPDEYWDAVAQELRSMRRPYLSLGIRTDAPNSEMAVRVRRILDALPGHPLAARLSFENPLTTFRDSLPRRKKDNADGQAGTHRTPGSPRGSTVTRS
jgi:hypothetical protein